MGNSRQSVKLLIVGTIVGIASMVPGLSGAVLAVCLGIYERLIADLADLRNKIRKDLAFLVLVGCGMILGTFIVSFGLDYVIENYKAISFLFFVGLIVGQLPSLINQTDRSKPVTQSNILALVVGLIVMAIIALIGGYQNEIIFDHNIFSCICMVAIGAIFAISHLVPGISGTTVLLALGVLTALTNAITELDFIFLIPILLGLVIGVLSFAKIVHRSITNHRNSTYFLILGLVLGSIAIIVSDAITIIAGWEEVVLGFVFFLFGILVSLGLSKFSIASSAQEY